LSPAIAEDDVPRDSLLELGWVSLDADEAGLLGVLEVVAVALGDFAVDCLLHPGDGVDQAVPPLLHELDRERVLGVDGPHQQHSVLLQFVHWDAFDELVGERVVLDGHSAGGLRGRQLPGRIHHDDVEQTLRHLQLLLDQQVEVEIGDVCADGHCFLPHVAALH
jgi:hypothetical protein